MISWSEAQSTKTNPLIFKVTDSVAINGCYFSFLLKSNFNRQHQHRLDAVVEVMTTLKEALLVKNWTQTQTHTHTVKGKWLTS